jgi:hypothetical protein
MENYKLIQSALGGIYGAQIGLDDAEAIAALKNDLKQPLFREGLEKELERAFSDASLSWAKLIDDCEVTYFDSEEEAREFAKEFLWNIVFPGKDI